jgi:hypothetical protein
MARDGVDILDVWCTLRYALGEKDGSGVKLGVIVEQTIWGCGGKVAWLFILLKLQTAGKQVDFRRSDVYATFKSRDRLGEEFYTDRRRTLRLLDASLLMTSALNPLMSQSPAVGRQSLNHEQ